MYEKRRTSSQRAGIHDHGPSRGCFLTLILLLLAGCGGGGGHAGAPAAQGTGSVVITIEWPGPTPDRVTAQHLPQDSRSVRIRIEDANNPNQLLAESTVARAPNQAQVTHTFDDIRVGPAVVRVTAYDSSGNELATASGRITVSRRTQTAVPVHLAPIATVTILPEAGIVEMQKSVTFSVEARDAQGVVLFVPTGTVSWLSDNPNVARANADGSVSGGDFGTATLTATVSDNGGQVTRTGTKQISVTEFGVPQITGNGPTGFINKQQKPTLLLTALVTDPTPSSGLNTASARLSLDGVAQPLPPESLEQPSSNVIVLKFTPPPTLAEGKHSVSFEISDRAGNPTRAVPWEFQVDTVSPVIQGTPTRTATANGLTVRITDAAPSSGLNLATAQLTVNGSPADILDLQPPTIPDPSPTQPLDVTLTFTSSRPLGSADPVVFTIADKAGNPSVFGQTGDVVTSAKFRGRAMLCERLDTRWIEHTTSLPSIATER